MISLPDLLTKIFNASLAVSLIGLIGILIASGRQKRGAEGAAKIISEGNKEIKFLDGTIFLRTEEIKDRAQFEERIQKWSESQDKRIAGLEDKITKQEALLDLEKEARRLLSDKLFDANTTIKVLQSQVEELTKLVQQLKDDHRKSRQECEETITRQQDEIAELVAKQENLLAHIRDLEQGVIQ